ncbi:Uncharacterised protein [Vibrio cholerae]|nr:Uncharacterised protein [Vibrio cholerae]
MITHFDPHLDHLLFKLVLLSGQTENLMPCVGKRLLQRRITIDHPRAN